MKEENTETTEQNKKPEDNLAKIAITKEADRALIDVVSRVNESFDAGKATKLEVTSQIILNFAKACVEADIHAMRTLFFDPVTVLDSMTKKAKETGTVPDHIRQYLYEQFMATSANQRPAKKSKKVLKGEALFESIEKEGDVA